MFVQQRKRRCMIVPSQSTPIADSSISAPSSPPAPSSSESSAVDNNPPSPSSNLSSSVPLLTSNAVTVSNNKGYPCRICGIPFSSSSNRSRHEKNVKHKAQVQSTLSKAEGQ